MKRAVFVKALKKESTKLAQMLSKALVNVRKTKSHAEALHNSSEFTAIINFIPLYFCSIGGKAFWIDEFGSF